jgi:hypothetical protein
VWSVHSPRTPSRTPQPIPNIDLSSHEVEKPNVRIFCLLTYSCWSFSPFRTAGAVFMSLLWIALCSGCGLGWPLDRFPFPGAWSAGLTILARQYQKTHGPAPPHPPPPRHPPQTKQTIVFEHYLKGLGVWKVLGKIYASVGPSFK